MFGFAKKVGMATIFVNGKSTAVTALELGTNAVLQKKTTEKDGYEALQIGAFPKHKKANKPQQGHTKKHSSKESNYAVIGEFRFVQLSPEKQTITIDDITEGLVCDISATTKGRGFAGVVKRHKFRGQPASRGHDHVRSQGSIGSRWPQRTPPGRRMAGHMGHVKRTVKNLKVVGVDKEASLFFVAGSVPGPNNAFVAFSQAKNPKQ